MFDVFYREVLHDPSEISALLGRAVDGYDLMLGVIHSQPKLYAVVCRFLGHYCGYLVGEREVIKVYRERSVHGGWTFEDAAPFSALTDHVVLDPAVSWETLGFDCAHSQDWTRFDQRGVYRDADFVWDELNAVVSSIPTFGDLRSLANGTAYDKTLFLYYILCGYYEKDTEESSEYVKTFVERHTMNELLGILNPYWEGEYWKHDPYLDLRATWDCPERDKWGPISTRLYADYILKLMKACFTAKRYATALKWFEADLNEVLKDRKGPDGCDKAITRFAARHLKGEKLYQIFQRINHDWSEVRIIEAAARLEADFTIRGV